MNVETLGCSGPFLESDRDLDLTRKFEPKVAEARKLFRDSICDEAKLSHAFEHLIESREVSVI